MLWVRVREDEFPKHDYLVPLSKVQAVRRAFNDDRDDIVDLGRGESAEVGDESGCIANALYRISPSGIHKVTV